MNHKNLDVWKKSMDLVEFTYKISSIFPESEKFGLTSQMRRAAVSVPSNIAEGAARKGNKEFIQYLYMAIGSLSELETQYLIAIRLSYMDKNEEFENLLVDVKKILIGFKNYLNKN